MVITRAKAGLGEVEGGKEGMACALTGMLMEGDWTWGGKKIKK